MLPAVKWETAASESQHQISSSWRLNDISGNRVWKRCQDETQFGLYERRGDGCKFLFLDITSTGASETLE